MVLCCAFSLVAVVVDRNKVRSPSGGSHVSLPSPLDLDGNKQLLSHFVRCVLSSILFLPWLFPFYGGYLPPTGFLLGLVSSTLHGGSPKLVAVDSSAPINGCMAGFKLTPSISGLGRQRIKARYWHHHLRIGQEQCKNIGTSFFFSLGFLM